MTKTLVILVAIIFVFCFTVFSLNCYGEMTADEIHSTFEGDGVAEWITEVVGDTKYRVAQFRPGVTLVDASPVELFQRVLTEYLSKSHKNLNTTPGQRTEWVLDGTIELDQTDSKFVELKLTLKSRKDEKEKLVSFSKNNVVNYISPHSGLAASLADLDMIPNVVDPEDDEEKFSTDITVGKDSILNGSDYKIEILDIKNNPYNIEIKDIIDANTKKIINKYFLCNFQSGDIFSIQITNLRDDIDIGVEVTIDGANVLDLYGKDSNSDSNVNAPQYFVVKAGVSQTITGWLTGKSGKNNCYQFKAGDYETSVARELNIPQASKEVGEITFLFRGTQKPGGTLGDGTAEPGVGKGERISVNVEEVQMTVDKNYHQKVSLNYTVSK